MNQIWGALITSVFVVMISWMGQVALFDRQRDSLDALRSHVSELNPRLSVTGLIPAIRVLQQADGIESRLIGASASESQQHQALQKLIRHEQSEPALMRLLADNNPVAQLYGLLGLQQSGSAQFETYLPFIEHSRLQVQLQSGCTVFIRPVSAFTAWSGHFIQPNNEKKGVLFTRPVMP